MSLDVPIKRLVAQSFRNLQSVDLNPAETINFISGDNGSGKTSLLEVIFTLAVGRSFRSRKFRDLISYECHALQLFADYLSSDGLGYRIGVIRQRNGDSAFRVNGESVSSALELATLMPCQVLDHSSFGLLGGGPGERRAFLDWLVFHVKPKFKYLWAEYNRCLKHRNSLLRTPGFGESEFRPWNQKLAVLGEEIDQHRKEICAQLQPVFRVLVGECGFLRDGILDIQYQSGWNDGVLLVDQLDRSLRGDQKLGYTSVGPHRADLRVFFNKRPLVDVCSRGQLKTVVAALHISQLTVYRQLTSGSCVFLVDDLPAELDGEGIQLLCRWLAAMEKVQIFVTGIETGKIEKFWRAQLASNSIIDIKTFHVKHGQVSDLPASGENYDRQ